MAWALMSHSEAYTGVVPAYRSGGLLLLPCSRRRRSAWAFEYSSSRPRRAVCAADSSPASHISDGTWKAGGCLPVAHSDEKRSSRPSMT